MVGSYIERSCVRLGAVRLDVVLRARLGRENGEDFPNDLGTAPGWQNHRVPHQAGVGTFQLVRSFRSRPQDRHDPFQSGRTDPACGYAMARGPVWKRPVGAQCKGCRAGRSFAARQVRDAAGCGGCTRGGGASPESVHHPRLGLQAVFRRDTRLSARGLRRRGSPPSRVPSHLSLCPGQCARFMLKSSL
jgi:hypothetical protein